MDEQISTDNDPLNLKLELTHAQQTQSYIQSTAVFGLFILACIYTLYFTRVILVPIMVAVLFSFLLSPAIRALRRLFIPQSLSALLVILVFIGMIAFGFYSLYGPARNWINKGPQTITQAIAKLQSLLPQTVSNLTGLSRVTQQVKSINSPATSTPASMSDTSTPASTSIQAGFLSYLFLSTSALITQMTIIILLLYFLLASEDFFLRNTVEAIPRLKGKKEVIVIVREIERKISAFLVARAICSIILIAIITIVLLLFHMPNSLLWGILAGIFDFIPYLGVIITTALISIAAIMHFPDIGHIILIPTVYFSLSSMTDTVLLPLLLSRSLTLHPVVIFVGVIFWGWIWGAPGALIAVPMLSILKIICDNVESLNFLGNFLGRSE